MMLGPYTVLDFTDERGEIGPMLMGDLGADVIRVESPEGTASRTAAPLLEGAPDDLASLSFLAFNRNKRSIVLDPDSPDDRAVLDELIRRSDFLFEPWPESPLSAYGVDFDRARALNPRIVHVRLSPWGEDGPYADYQGNDLVVAAMGGPVALQGTMERPPVRLSVPQIWRHAGVEAAAGAMAAHQRMLRTGVAQYVDLSAQSVLTWTMLNAMDAYAIQGADFQRGGGLDTGTTRINMIFPCADGYILALPHSKVLLGCLPWMIDDGVADASLKEIDWPAYDLNLRNPDHEPLNVYQASDMLRAFFAGHSKLELFEYGLKTGITLAPINTLPELLDLEHLKIREYWMPMSLPDGRTLPAPGLWGKSHQAVLSVRRGAPGLDEHGAEIRAEIATPPKPAAYPEPDDGLPFEGITVADFSWVGVGPISAKYLADHGARVIRVESETRPDVLRGNPPFKDMVPGLDRSQFFGDFNTSKQSLTLNMKLPEAVEIARELIRHSDVMIESFAAGAIHRLGLSYEEVRKLNPGLIKISTCLMGQTGPAAALAGYGYHAGAIAGFYEITGWPDLPPSGPWVAYTDTIAPRFISVLLAAALDHRRRTGEGCYVDVAQIEASLHFLTPELLDLQANGVAATRIGNRSTRAAPQGCYRCHGEDRWCAVAVDTDAQWLSLAREMGREDLAADPALAAHAGRLAAHDRIDDAINAWTSGQDAYDVMRRLQAAGVPAGVVQRSSDLLQDPQYGHRQFYRYLDHPVMGHIPYAGHQYRIRGYDNGPRGPAPTLGEHSYEILAELLGFSDDRIAEAYASGAVA
ncbi:MAG: CoA transferase [Pseudomonadales bacterium]|jgi:crotonobetainyl-CoA:carnitine CoA-transferase CaiB-like acyl-CoA transferase